MQQLPQCRTSQSPITLLRSHVHVFLVMSKSFVRQDSTHERYSDKLTEDLSTELIDTFMCLDKLNHGRISSDDLLIACKCFGLEPTNDINERIKRGDAVQLSEYMSILTKLMENQDYCSNEVQEVFDIIDQERKGHITIPDIKRFFHDIGEKQMDMEIEEQILGFTDNDMEGNIIMGKPRFSELLADSSKK